MTREEYVDKVIEYALAGVEGTDNSTLVDQQIEVETLCANALQEFAALVARDPEKSYYLQKTVSVPLTNGTAVLPPELFGESSVWGLVLDEDGNVCNRVQYAADLQRPITEQFTHFCLTGGHVITKKKGTGTGSGLQDTQSLNVTLNFELGFDTLTLLHPTLEDELINFTVIRLRQARGGG
jgi:hypothetical protein